MSRRLALALLFVLLPALNARAADLMYGGVNCGQASRSLSLVLRLTADGTESTSVLASQVTANYWRQGALRTSIATATLANAAVAYASGGFTEVDGTNMKGLYRLDLPDAAIACGADWVSVNVTRVYGAASYVYHERLGLASAPDVNVIRWNQTSVAATQVDANVTEWNGTAIIATKVDANTRFWNGTAVIATTVDANTTKWNGTLVTATRMAANVEAWNGTLVNALISGRVDANTQATAAALTYALTGNITGNLSGSVGSVTGAVGSVTARVTANTDQWNGTAVIATSVDANTRFWNFTAVIATAVTANATQWNGTAVIATRVDVNLVNIAGSAVSTSTAQLGVNLVNVAGAAVNTALAQLGVNTVTVGGTAQTGRDLGASVLISPGTGTGQLGVSAGRITIQTYLQKNAAALKFPFIMTDSTTHAPKTGLTSAALGCVRSIDGGASATGTIANIAETDSGGYVLDFGAGDVNGNAIKLRCTANSADDTILTLYTYP